MMQGLVVVLALVSALLHLQACVAHYLPSSRDTPLRPLKVHVYDARDLAHHATTNAHRSDDPLVASDNEPKERISYHNSRVGDVENASKKEKRLLISYDRRNVTLRLKPKVHLLGPSAHVARYNGNWSENARLTSGCHYDGYVDDDVVSDSVAVAADDVVTSAAVNLCGGLSGFISTARGDYFIHPDDQQESPLGEHHLLYPVQPQEWIPPARELHPYHQPPKFPKRSKRHAGEHRYHMELLLVADETIKDFHGESRANEYLMTLINMVDSVYHHPTLGVKLNVVISKLMYIKKDTASSFIVIGDAIQSLARFCHWVNSFIVHDEDSPDHFDFAVFITKENIGPSGYAPVTGMCNPSRSCSVIRDEGFSTAFIIAHEIGHVFGIVHDGQGNDCSGTLLDGRIMAPLVQSTYSQHFWSHCAAEFLLAAIDNFQCLRDDPHERVTTENYPEPYGTRWSASEQCRQEFGEGFKICLAFSMPLCGSLWCSTPDNHLLCKSKKGPALTGTDCGYGRWCVGGQCVSRNIRPDTDVDGGWSAFSDWMTCSRNCGGGVQVRVRSCNNPHPLRNGKPCDGPKGEFRLCNTHECDWEQDFWALQCSTLDWEVVAGRRHTWLPYQLDQPERECKLTCKSNDTNQVFKTKEDLIDGTFCSYEEKYRVCIRGTCQSIGCDRVLGSENREDLCGVCNGDNSTCAEITGSFNRRVERGYNRMFIFPIGARNVKVYETVRQRHFIALRSRADSVYLLNGKGRPYRRRHFVHKGTRWRYRNGRTVQETLRATGPLSVEYEVMLFGSRYGGRTANFTFQYFISNDVATGSSGNFARRAKDRTYERYVWDTQGWSECSRSCGGGVQYEIYVCIDQYHHRHANSTSLCAENWVPQPDRRPCNMQTCQIYNWDPQPWSVCSATCGRQGVQKRTVNCLHEKDDGGLENVEQSRCDYVQRPVSVHECNVRPCPGRWQMGPWSQGRLRLHRRTGAHCRSNRVELLGDCQSQIASSQSHLTPIRVQPPTQCSHTCDGGVQKRRVECVGQYFTKCLDRAPSDRQRCNTDPCSGGQGHDGRDPLYDEKTDGSEVGRRDPTTNYRSRVNKEAGNNVHRRKNRIDKGRRNRPQRRRKTGSKNTKRRTVNLLTTRPTESSKTTDDGEDTPTSREGLTTIIAPTVSPRYDRSQLMSSTVESRSVEDGIILPRSTSKPTEDGERVKSNGEVGSLASTSKPRLDDEKRTTVLFGPPAQKWVTVSRRLPKESTSRNRPSTPKKNPSDPEQLTPQILDNAGSSVIAPERTTPRWNSQRSTVSPPRVVISRPGEELSIPSLLEETTTKRDKETVTDKPLETTTETTIRKSGYQSERETRKPTKPTKSTAIAGSGGTKQRVREKHSPTIPAIQSAITPFSEQSKNSVARPATPPFRVESSTMKPRARVVNSQGENDALKSGVNDEEGGRGVVTSDQEGADDTSGTAAKLATTTKSGDVSATNEATATNGHSTEMPTTEIPTTEIPTTEVPTTELLTTGVATTVVPTTEIPTIEIPTTEVPTTEIPTTKVPTTEIPTTKVPTTKVPTTEVPTTEIPTTEVPTTVLPTTTVEPASTTVGTTTPLPECYDRTRICKYIHAFRCKWKLYQNICCETCYYLHYYGRRRARRED